MKIFPYFALLLIASAVFTLATPLNSKADDRRIALKARSSTVVLTINDKENVIFSHGAQACEVWDIPDTSARAYRDEKSQIHLIATHWSNRAMIGPDFRHLVHDCRIIFAGHGDPDPSQFSDAGWIESTYTQDGKNVFALISMDYHPSRHGLPCGVDQVNRDGCWYNAIVLAVSKDGGLHFDQAKSDAGFVLGPLQKFDPKSTLTVGALVPTNIISYDGFYYTLVSMASSKGHYECLIRTGRLDDPRGWRAWSNGGFGVEILNPYNSDGRTLETCEPVGSSILYPAVRSWAKLPGNEGFLATMLKYNPDANGAAGVYIAYSPDMIHWEQRTLLLPVEVFGARCKMGVDIGYQYPSLISADDQSRNFEYAYGRSFLFLTRFNKCGYSNRDLVAFPVEITYGK